MGAALDEFQFPVNQDSRKLQTEIGEQDTGEGEATPWPTYEGIAQYVRHTPPLPVENDCPDPTASFRSTRRLQQALGALPM